jgi:hypothetical protein
MGKYLHLYNLLLQFTLQIELRVKHHEIVSTAGVEVVLDCGERGAEISIVSDY